jgi:hypothetical protein
MFATIFPKVTDMRIDSYDQYGDPIPAADASFGKDFNLIRAVQDVAPGRIDAIGKRLADLALERETLENERAILTELVKVVQNA